MAHDSSTSLTSISQLGEFGLIEHLTKDFPAFDARLLKAVGDDAAVVKSPGEEVQVFSSDLLLEGVHFDLAYVPLRHLGYKAVVVNLSDIVAMNAQPYGITVNVGLSNRFSVEAVEELYAGIRLACEAYQVDLLGGDTSSSRQGLVISVTAFGRASEEQIVYRSGAQANDLICVSGDLGAAYAGLLVLDREKTAYLDKPDIQPDLSDYDYVVGRQLKPEARIDIIRRLAELQLKPSSMMDVSDGIASELHHICRQSKKGAKIFANKLPIDHQTVAVAEEFDISPTTFALNGGEDYELIFTLPVSAFERIKAEREITIIGHITDDENLIQLVLETGQAVEVEAQGWQHFKS
ncbi:MAG: thiamine-phosphate kinase [Bacteroidetes bacterium]|nr:MAG: thiamine-phosphate kinase [Bacteroidota bacterium]